MQRRGKIFKLIQAYGISKNKKPFNKNASGDAQNKNS